jgi:hypothetical protein
MQGNDDLLGRRKMSQAFMRQTNYKRNLNECLHAQNYYIEFEIKDPEGELVCEAAMSYDQFVRLLLCQSEVTVTLVKYRGLDGEMKEEEVPVSPSVTDNLIEKFGDAGQSLNNRIMDARKDVYEMLNSGKKPSKKALEKLLHDIEVIESHNQSNMPYFVERAAEQVSDITDNAKSQLSIFAQNILNVDMSANDFAPLIESKSVLPLPDKTAVPIEDSYELAEREQKSIAEMSAMEVGDALTARLRQIEAAENKYYNKIKGDYSDRKHLFGCHASGHGNKFVDIVYISYHGSSKTELEKAKRYLEFLLSVKSIQEFKTAYWFEKKE